MMMCAARNAYGKVMAARNSISHGAVLDILAYYAPYVKETTEGLVALLRRLKQDKGIGWIRECDREMYDGAIKCLEEDEDTNRLKGIQASSGGEKYDSIVERYDVSITSDSIHAERILKELTENGSPLPLYLDSERSYEQLKNGGRIALLIILDEESSRVLLWRIHNYSDVEVVAVRNALEKAQETRQLVVCGQELMVGNINVFNVQAVPADNGKTDLVSLAAEFQLTLTEDEAMSCWTVQNLRRDQINHCIMNVYALHVVYWRRLMRDNQEKFQDVAEKRERFYEEERCRKDEERHEYRIWRYEQWERMEERIEDLKSKLDRKKRHREEMENRHLSQRIQRQNEMAALCRVHEGAESSEELERKNVDDDLEELRFRLEYATEELYDL